LLLAGSNSVYGLRYSATSAQMSMGGAAARGGGYVGGAFISVATNGTAGAQYGGGGCGGIAISAVNANGGAGSQGVIQITEYF
jgi:hypothetical protein